MAIIDLGKIGLTLDNSGWSASTTYEKYTVITYDGEGYCSLKDNTNVTPGTDSTTWMKITERGESLYEMMVRTGRFSGTEAEFLQEYQDKLSACTTAASSANTAATAANSAASSCSATNTAVANAETARVTAETNRASAESARVSAESSRVSAETSRASAETARDDAETIRQSKESGRQSAETGRQSAETERAAAEGTRASNETSRASAETARANAETARASAETSRASAESTRVSNEAARGTAEASRASAETARESQAASDHSTATSDHSQAGTDHSTAASDHTQAGTDHSTASSDHTTAASDHTQAETDHTQAESDHAAIAPTIAKAHEHSNKSELDLIVTGDKAKWDGMLPKAVPTAAQGTKEYLYTFAGSAQNTDVALINDMSSGSESYTDKMVPTAKSVATALEDKQSLVSGTHTDEIASLDSDGKVVASGHEIAELDQLRADVDSIDVDNMGDAHAKSVDMDEIPKVCGFPMILFGTAAPDVTPDFIGQTFIDTANGKIYMASDVANASSFKVLN